MGRLLRALPIYACTLEAHNSLGFATFPPGSSRSRRRRLNGLRQSPERSLNFDTDDDDDDDARSSFGTRQYWDDVYTGLGDFPSDSYSWYYSFDVIKPHLEAALRSRQESVDSGGQFHDALWSSSSLAAANAAGTSKAAARTPRILVPGIGNDLLLLDLYKSKFRNLTAFDYSPHAIERQQELLSSWLEPRALKEITLLQRDARLLDDEWANAFDVVIEKGTLDAIYLSSNGNANIERAVEELERVLVPGGILVSVSGVVPAELRRGLFAQDKWEWIRDGTSDLKAGCFVLKLL